MANYCSSRLVYYFIYIFNFCETFLNNSIEYVSLKINTQLEGRVLYYAMYTKGSQGEYYTKLYDHTSTFSKLKLIMLSFIYNNYCDRNSVFTYNDVHANIENLTSFMIDAVIVSYIEDGFLTSKILSCDENNNTLLPNAKFVYALVVLQNGEEYDFTKELNIHLGDIKNSPLTIKDFVHIISVKYQKNCDNMLNMTLKTMMDDDFNEVVYNSNDKFEF
jgi:hypothetical protein